MKIEHKKKNMYTHWYKITMDGFRLCLWVEPEVNPLRQAHGQAHTKCQAIYKICKYSPSSTLQQFEIRIHAKATQQHF